MGGTALIAAVKYVFAGEMGRVCVCGCDCVGVVGCGCNCVGEEGSV